MSDNNFNPLGRYTTQTVTVSQDALRMLTAEYGMTRSENEEAKLDPIRELTFIVRGLPERVMIGQLGEVKLGRFEPAHRQDNTLDLTPYGAADRGVSRFHARIHVEDNVLFITDMNSTNGTYIEGVKISPHTSTPLYKGNKLVLGLLPLQVMFR
jgi:hypothetical protein